MWMILFYGTISVIIISIAGLAVITFVPLFQKDQQSNLSQIFVGLAIGTLCSDALLHLIPHGISSLQDYHSIENESTNLSLVDHLEEFNTKNDGHHNHNHREFIWLGIYTLAGINCLLVFERLIKIFTDFTPNETIEPKDTKCLNDPELLAPELQKLNHNHNNSHEMKDLSDVIKTQELQVHEECHRSTISFPKPNGDGFIHIASHHHHHHTTHRGPSVALMVLFGDIVHNLFDGLAIGVAFAGSGISGGISTSIAVLCHEIPHELGDFTIIIRSGMLMRRVIYWNIFASLVCWCGMCLGVFLGQIQDSWLSMLIAGTFIYIALACMVPELDSCPQLPIKSRAMRLFVQLFGISVGISIMLAISWFENQIFNVFN